MNTKCIDVHISTKILEIVLTITTLTNILISQFYSILLKQQCIRILNFLRYLKIMILLKKRTVFSAAVDCLTSDAFSMRLFHKTPSCKKCLTPDTVNPNLRSIDYAIRGLLFQKTVEIENEMLQGIQKPFKYVMRLNIGDAQSLGQPPITFLRQVLVLTSYPVLINDKTFPNDVKLRAKSILDKCPGGSVGSYSDACGIEMIRRQIASYIEERDKVPSHWRNCILGHGAGDMAKKFLNILRYDNNGLKPGILTPVPEYPFYSATMTELGLKRIDYYLEEDNNWHVNVHELQRAVDEARKTCNPRAIIVINPGNPTSHVLSRESIEEIIKFAYRENLIIIADEVYQDNILKTDCQFVSFKRVMSDLGEPYNTLELVSLMSVSKGCFAESGIKGGFAEVVNMDPEVVPMFVKSISAMLCPSVLAQAAVYALVNPPKPGEPSYEQFQHERKSIVGAFKMSAAIAEESFNSLDGIFCNPIEGAIFSYPQLRLPQKAISEAHKRGISPDEYYALELLNETGICVVPGSGFKQLPGKYHIRMTLLPQPDQLHKLMERYKQFHYKFLRKFSDYN
ncbi:hypothetical protein HHI36_012056 [Cryptolaemus montrouzieri]|uniref:Alanine aminotransferase 1 n=1 Tax=Cryptolaemus montrouzieri TaxID=559131 RepID=A0ABD2NEP7_9CUCU